jgi:hypothetical protein
VEREDEDKEIVIGNRKDMEKGRKRSIQNGSERREKRLESEAGQGEKGQEKTRTPHTYHTHPHTPQNTISHTIHMLYTQNTPYTHMYITHTHTHTHTHAQAPATGQEKSWKVPSLSPLQ